MNSRLKEKLHTQTLYLTVSLFLAFGIWFSVLTQLQVEYLTFQVHYSSVLPEGVSTKLPQWIQVKVEAPRTLLSKLKNNSHSIKIPPLSEGSRFKMNKRHFKLGEGVTILSYYPSEIFIPQRLENSP